MSAQSIIHYYNRLNGNAISLPKLKEFRERLQKHIDDAGGHGPYAVEIKGIFERTTKCIKMMISERAEVIERLNIKPIEIKELKGKTHSAIAERIRKATPKKVKEKVKKLSAKKVAKHNFKHRGRGKKKAKTVVLKPRKQVAGLSAPQSAVKAAIKPTVVSKQPGQLSGLPKQKNLSGVTHHYYAHDLGQFTPELVKMNSDAVAMFWGMPGHGKTGKMLLLAQHFANQGKKVFYVADEEYGKSTLEEKFKDLNLEPKFKISGTLTDKDLEQNEIFFFDSVNTMGLNPKSVKEMVRKYPGRTYNLILQTTKEGDFRGGNDWEHLVDVAGEIKNRKITLVKNRFDKDNATKFQQKQMDDAIAEAQKKANIRNALKEKIEPQPKAA